MFEYPNIFLLTYISDMILVSTGVKVEERIDYSLRETAETCLGGSEAR